MKKQKKLTNDTCIALTEKGCLQFTMGQFCFMSNFHHRKAN